MLHCNDIDHLMVDWLYGELDSSRATEISGHVEGCGRCQAEQAAFSRTRELFTALPSDEPPSSITAMLVREAALSAKPAKAPAAQESRSRGGFAEWMSRLFAPLMHPAVAAVATLLLVVGVAGALYVRKGNDQFAEPSVATVSPSSEGEAEKANDPTQGAAVSAQPGAATIATSAPEPAFELAKEAADKDARIADIVSKDQATALRENTDESKNSRRRYDSAVKGPAKKSKSVPPSLASTANEDRDGDGTFADDNIRGGGESAKGDAFGYRGQKTKSWTDLKEGELVSAYESQDCRKAASIANDIRDRDPKHYKAKTAELDAVKKCRYYVEVETKRRTSVARKAAAARSKANKGGAAGTTSKAAAEEQNESAADAPTTTE